MELNDLVLQACMERCIELAQRAPSIVGRPFVGAMVVSEDGNIIGEGYKQLLTGTKFLQHAERVALDAADQRARRGYLFTTLEPCVEEKDSKPHVFCSCSKLIVDRGISTVIVGLLDNSPSMKPGSGIAYLRARGIDVRVYQNQAARIIQDLMPLRYQRPT